MGRKKIEIKPLTDERNRNVTFLKRKAGLMKKAWELSVLCSADVSIVIFAPSGKCFEFTSVEDGAGLDGQVARYIEYEGSIERRRAPEFAAAAARGDDDSGDEDGGNKKQAGQGSLKGKEEWKDRTVLPASSKRPSKRTRVASASDVSRSSSRSRSPPAHHPYPHQHAQAHQSYGAGYGNGPSQYPAAGHSHPHAIPTAPPIRSTADPATSANLQYALSMNGNAPQPSLNSLYPSYPPQNASHSEEPAWDAQTLARLAELQLQQDHQRQQRALLERQRRQLMDLGVPSSGDPAFMDMIFGSGSGRNEPFVWPTTQQHPREEHHAQPQIYGRQGPVTPFTFPSRPTYQEQPEPSSAAQQQQQHPDYQWENGETKVES